MDERTARGEVMPSPEAPIERAQVERMLREHAAMAAMVASMNAQVAQMAAMLREMVTLTRAQEAALKTAVNGRAKALCAQYGLPAQCARKIAARIRQSVTAPSGVRALRDIPRCEYRQALETAQDYDRPGMLRRMAREAGEAHESGSDL